MKTKHILTLTALFTMLATATTFAKPLKVYIMTGQSNMQGKASPSTVPAMAKYPESKELHDKMLDENGEPRIYNDVYLSYLTSGRTGAVNTNGPLGVGEDTFGPELAFGITMHEKLNEPFLIIKAAWGGRSINTEFRPPSAGPYYADPDKVEDRQGNRGIIPAAQLIADKEKKTGVSYRDMMNYVNSVLADPGKHHPAYDPKQGYEIAGFVWFQGYNDMIDNSTYKGAGDDKYKEYSRLMKLFIQDVRKDLKTPDMPFVIGVLGLGGETDGPFQKAQAAPAQDPQLENVTAVLTGKYWDHRLGELDDRNRKYKNERYDQEGKYTELREKTAALRKEMGEIKGRSAEDKQKREEIERKIKDIVYTKEEQEILEHERSNAGFHYLGSAKIYSQIGEAFAKSLIAMKKSQ